MARPHFPKTAVTGNTGLVGGIRDQSGPADINSAAVCLNMRRPEKYLRRRTGNRIIAQQYRPLSDHKYMAFCPFQADTEHYAMVITGLRGVPATLYVMGLSCPYTGTKYSETEDGYAFTYSDRLSIVRSPRNGKFYLTGYSDRIIEITVSGAANPTLEVVDLEFEGGLSSSPYVVGMFGCAGVEFGADMTTAYWGIDQQLKVSYTPPDDNDYFAAGSFGARNGFGWVDVDRHYVFWSEPLASNLMPYNYYLSFRDPVVTVKYYEESWYIFTEQAVYVWTIPDAARGIARKVGTIQYGVKSAESVVATPYGIIFANGEGVHAVAGTDVRTISDNVADYFMSDNESVTDTTSRNIISTFTGDASLEVIRFTDNGGWIGSFDTRTMTYWLSCSHGERSFNNMLLELCLRRGEAFIHTHNSQRQDDVSLSETTGDPLDKFYYKPFTISGMKAVDGTLYAVNRAMVSEMFYKNSDWDLSLVYSAGPAAYGSASYKIYGIWLSQPLLANPMANLEVVECELQAVCRGVGSGFIVQNKVIFYSDRAAFGHLAYPDTDEIYDMRDTFLYPRVDDTDMLLAFMGNGTTTGMATWGETYFHAPERTTIQFRMKISEKCQIFRIIYLDIAYGNLGDLVRWNLKIRKGTDVAFHQVAP